MISYQRVSLALIFFPILLYSQTPITKFDRGLVVGNLLIQGYMAIKGDGSAAKKADPNAKTVESFCFKNKMEEKITVKMEGEINDEEIKKEFVIQKGEKECTYDLPKGVYTYEILLSSKDIYQKGEYKVTEETMITVNKN